MVPKVPAQPKPAAENTRADMVTALIPSHGATMNGLVYVAAGAGPHPLVVLLHGFPGNEQNLDLAQDIRRAGWDVLFFHYRGAWGSGGDYSFSHTVEDVAAAIAYVKDKDIAAKIRLDPARIVVIGHSMGGFDAVQAAAADPSIAAVGLISAADIGGRVPEKMPKMGEGIAKGKIAAALRSQGMEPLVGCTPETLAQDVLDHAAQWRFSANAKALATRPLLNLTADDGLAESDDAFADAVKKAGETNVTAQHFATDHSYSDQRQELSAAVLTWLKGLPVTSK